MTGIEMWDRRFRLSILTVLSSVTLLSAADTAPNAAKDMTLAIAPAVMMLKGKPGLTSTQTVTISNLTDKNFTFDVEIEDVVVQDGKRAFRNAGENPGGPAASASVSPQQVFVPAGTNGAVKVTFVMPSGSHGRAAVVMFKGREKVVSASTNVPGSTVNLGALVTFCVSSEFQITATPATVSAQSATANSVVSQFVKNIGPEPVIPKGVAAILNQQGKVAGKAVFEPQRLLPGEQLEFKAEYPAQLAPGKYRVICSLEYEGETLTTMGEFSVE